MLGANKTFSFWFEGLPYVSGTKVGSDSNTLSFWQEGLPVITYSASVLITKIINETCNISDSLIKILIHSLSKIINETLQISDSIIRNINLRRYINETLQIGDSILNIIKIGIQIIVSIMS